MNGILSPTKILNHLDRVYYWTQGKIPPPISVDVDLTNRCSNNCPDCIGMRRPLVDLENPEKILKELAEIGTRSVIFTGGGEPTLHEGFVEYVKLSHTLGMDVGVTTNGVTLTKQISEAIKPYCIWIRVSFTGDSPEMYRMVHGVDFFEPVLRNIRYLGEAEGKATIGVGYLTGEHTISGMREATRLIKETGVDYIQFRPFIFDYTSIYEEFEKCREFEDESFKVLVSYKDVQNAFNYDKCYAQYFHCVIAATGEVYVCCNLRGNPKYSLGNVYDNSFVDIWHSRRKPVDFNDCKKYVKVCRLNNHNRILWEISQEKEHKNFL